MLSKAPPLLPGLIADLSEEGYGNSTIFNLTIMQFIYPTVTDCPYPKAFPIAITISPALSISESPSLAT